MRLKTFTARERAAVIPIELLAAMRYGVIILPVLFLLGGLGGPGDFGQCPQSWPFCCIRFGGGIAVRCGFNAAFVAVAARTSFFLERFEHGSHCGGDSCGF